MAKRHNVSIPPTLLRTGLLSVERLMTIGISRDITMSDVDDVISQVYPERRKAARSLARGISEDDINEVNLQLDSLRHEVDGDSKYALLTSYARGICTIVC